MFESLHKLGQSATGRVTVRNALNPILWLCAIVTPICFSAAFAFRDHDVLLYALAIVGLLPVLVACGICIGFAIVCPERLQSEDYQIRHETLQIIQQKSGEIPMGSPSLEAIANPHSPLLGDSLKDSQ